MGRIYTTEDFERWGAKGGKARAKKLPPERRREIARHARSLTKAGKAAALAQATRSGDVPTDDPPDGVAGSVGAPEAL